MKGLGIGFLSILTAVALFFFGTRFTDGPLAIFTGGQFTSGVLESAPEDWSYLKDRDLIEFRPLLQQDQEPSGLLCTIVGYLSSVAI